MDTETGCTKGTATTNQPNKMDGYHPAQNYKIYPELYVIEEKIIQLCTPSSPQYSENKIEKFLLEKRNEMRN